MNDFSVFVKAVEEVANGSGYQTDNVAERGAVAMAFFAYRLWLVAVKGEIEEGPSVTPIGREK